MEDGAPAGFTLYVPALQGEHVSELAALPHPGGHGVQAPAGSVPTFESVAEYAYVE